MYRGEIFGIAATLTGGRNAVCIAVTLTGGRKAVPRGAPGTSRLIDCLVYGKLKKLI